MVKIKREKWKKNYVIVARDEKGKLVTWKKKITLKKAKALYKQNRTFSEKEKRTRLKNVTEIQRADTKIRKKAQYQYYIEATTRKGEKIAARSQQHPPSFPIKKAEEEAWENFYYRYAQFLGFSYDEEIGEEFYTQTKSRLQVKTGVVQYV